MIFIFKHLYKNLRSALNCYKKYAYSIFYLTGNLIGALLCYAIAMNVKGVFQTLFGKKAQNTRSLKKVGQISENENNWGNVIIFFAKYSSIIRDLLHVTVSQLSLSHEGQKLSAVNEVFVQPLSVALR